MEELKLMFLLKYKKRIKRKGFTLIELIIVMAIILVMASFLIPKFNGYRGKAERVKAIDTGRQIYVAAMESYMENKGVFNEGQLEKTSKELLGIEKLNIQIASDDNVVVNYDVDNKKYCLKFGKNSSNFYIDDEKGEIYPTYNPKNEKKTKPEDTEGTGSEENIS
ncbi:N-terminal cleavage protein [Clostridium novyi A str. 4570]|uniref:N-terminal cleavage protein n=1 Tax=Clostridium novyi A str. 4570 TaxID=1444290 RepID=A0AA89CMU7_CLONO|nr:type II secretion system protein [Clostridium novyi]KGN00999.1 N-terminal cleavage protein [Clostridium novyi A str. 4570]